MSLHIACMGLLGMVAMSVWLTRILMRSPTYDMHDWLRLMQRANGPFLTAFFVSAIVGLLFAPFIAQRTYHRPLNHTFPVIYLGAAALIAFHAAFLSQRAIDCLLPCIINVLVLTIIVCPSNMAPATMKSENTIGQ